MVAFINARATLPDTDVDLLIKFLIQNNGKLSKAKKDKFFDEISQQIIVEIENEFNKYFK